METQQEATTEKQRPSFKYAKGQSKALFESMMGRATELYAVAKEKGFWEKPRSIQHIFGLISTEICEGMDALRDLTVKDLPIYQMVNGVPVAYGPEWDPALKPEGHVIEVADAAVRLLDFIGYTMQNSDLTIETYMEFFEANQKDGQDEILYTFSGDGISDLELLNDFRQGIKQLYLVRENEPPQVRTGRMAMGVMCLVSFMEMANAYCQTHGFSLIEAMDIKVVYNKQRPYMHGKAH